MKATIISSPCREVHYFADTNQTECWTFREGLGWFREADDAGQSWEGASYLYVRHASRPAAWMGNDKIHPMPRIKI